MKITIDLNDPEITRVMTLAIEERLQALTAERVDAILTAIIDKKLDRLDITKIDEIAGKKIRDIVQEKITAKSNWNKPSMLEEAVRFATTDIV